MENNTCAVVVTYNRAELLQQCIVFLLQQNHPCDILIVDNASTDNTADIVKGFNDPRIVYYNTGENIGGAGGFNFGIKKAVESKYEYVWVMDDDTFAQPDTLEQFFIADEKLNGNYGWLSSKALWTDGTICEMNRQVALSRKSITDFSPELIPARSASFVSMFFRAAVIREVGLPIKEFFIWADDVEYSLRISRSHQCFVVSKSTVVHAMGSNLATDYVKLSVDRLPRAFYAARNRFYIQRREGIIGLCRYGKRFLLDFIKILLKASDHKFKRLYILIKGLIAGLFFFPGIEFVQKDEFKG